MTPDKAKGNSVYVDNNFFENGPTNDENYQTENYKGCSESSYAGAELPYSSEVKVIRSR